MPTRRHADARRPHPPTTRAHSRAHATRSQAKAELKKQRAREKQEEEERLKSEQEAIDVRQPSLLTSDLWGAGGAIQVTRDCPRRPRSRRLWRSRSNRSGARN